MPNGILMGYEVFYNGYETPNQVFKKSFQHNRIVFCDRILLYSMEV